MASHHPHGRSELRTARPGPPPASAPAAARPVFVDRSGRRRRLFTMVGIGLGAVLLIGLIVLVSSLFTGGPAQLPGWPGQDGAAKIAPSTIDGSADPRFTTRAPGPSTAPTTLSPTPRKSTAAPPGQTNTHKPTAKPTNTRRP